MGTHTTSTAVDPIRDRRTFTTSGALSGVNHGPDGVSGRFVPHGHLPHGYRDQLSQSVVAYVVYSYSTPIAWVTVEGEVVLPDVRYSVTTSRHQGVARRGLGVPR